MAGILNLIPGVRRADVCFVSGNSCGWSVAIPVARVDRAGAKEYLNFDRGDGH